MTHGPQTMTASDQIEISLIAPLFNEEGNIEELHKRCKSVLEGIGRSYEMIFVDDGSTDRTRKLLESLSKADSALRVLSFYLSLWQIHPSAPIEYCFPSS